MNVLLLTVFVGLALVAIFVVLFLRQSANRSGAGRAALQPLEEENPTPSKHEQP